MTQSLPPEGPEHRTQTLSPVSPKPLHFPSPANIPILEKSMDPDFDESNTTTQLETSQNDHEKSQSSGQMQSEIASYPQVADDSSAQHANGSIDGQGDIMQDSIDTYSSNSAVNPSVYATSTVPPPSQTLDNTVSNLSSTDAANPFSASNSHALASEPSHAAQADASQPDMAMGNGLADSSTCQNENGMIIEVNNGSSGGGGVNYQALLDNLSPTSAAVSSAIAGASNPVVGGPPGVTDTSSHLLALDTAPPSGPTSTPLHQGLANLPPRPPPTQEPSNSHQLAPEVKQYQLHDASVPAHKPISAGTAPAAPPPGTSYITPLPGNAPPPLLTTGAPGTTSSSNGLGPPPMATFQQQANTTPSNQLDSNFRQREPLIRRGSDEGDDRKEEDDIPWGPEVQKLYDSFLHDERMFVTEGQWDKFPTDSRLFIGNLPTEKVTKRDLFHVFHRHGKLAQISIKQAYGFIQYLDAASCRRALNVEQGAAIRGRKIHLEISKPQKLSNKNSGGGSKAQHNRRSRSPDYTKGGAGGNNNNGGGGGAQRADRYRGSGNNRQRDNNRNRDDYRPGRSPSPRARGSRNDFRRDRSPDRYNGRRRSRSRSPRGRGRQSPRSRSKIDDDCPLPRREPAQVPDIQIIAKGELDRTFVGYVEKTFASRGIRSDVLILSPRLDESAVMRRQILEGVIAVMKLDRNIQATQQFQLSIFDRSAGEDKVKFEEYNNQALNICVELVIRAKQTARPPAAIAASVYGLPMSSSAQYQQRLSQANAVPLPLQSHQQFPTQQQMPNQVNAPLDTSSLQKLLGRVQQHGQTPQSQFQAHPPPPPSFGQQGSLPITADLSRLLATASASNAGRPAQGYQPSSSLNSQQQQQQQHFQNFNSNQTLSNLLANLQQQQQQQQHQVSSQQQQQQQQHLGHQRQGSGAMHSQPQSPPNQSPAQQQPDMQSIMAQLANYGSR